jgi:4-alpha-glucanotransferase
MRLDNSARMNTPGVAKGNWTWRAGESDVWQKLEVEAKQLRRLAFAFDRLPEGEVDEL